MKGYLKWMGSKSNASKGFPNPQIPCYKTCGEPIFSSQMMALYLSCNWPRYMVNPMSCTCQVDYEGDFLIMMAFDGTFDGIRDHKIAP